MAESEGNRKLQAILAADVAGYSRLMRDDDEATVTTLEAYREVFRDRIQARRGRVVDMAGDSVLAVFEAATQAVSSAFDIQSEIALRNEALDDTRRMRFRIGVNLGEVIERPDGTVYGDGVNVAARLLAVLGAVHTVLRNQGTARIMLERAVAIDPNAAWAWSRLGWVENYSDRPERALPHFERALRLSPLDPMNFNNYVGMGSAHEVAGRYDEAIACYQRALQERPHAYWIIRNLASSLAGAGRMIEAAVEFKRLMTAYPDLTAEKFKKAMVFSPATLERMCANLTKLGLPE